MLTAGNMADDSKLLTISEEGCLRWNSNIRNVVYHKSLNVLLGFCPDGKDEAQVVVIDIASGTILHHVRLGNPLSVDVFNELADKTAEQQQSNSLQRGNYL